MASGSKTSALKEALHRTDLFPHAGSAEISPDQWLQDLYRHRRRSGLRARVRGTNVRHSARAGRRHGARDQYGYEKDGKTFLTKEPKLVLNDNDAGKPEGIHLIIGRRPHIAFGNSTGDQQMLNIPRPAVARACPCWCYTMTPRASTPTARRQDCRTRRSARSRRRSTTKRRKTDGSSSA